MREKITLPAPIEVMKIKLINKKELNIYLENPEFSLDSKCFEIKATIKVTPEFMNWCNKEIVKIK